MFEEKLGAGDMGHIEASSYVDVPSSFSCHKLVTVISQGALKGFQRWFLVWIHQRKRNC